MTKKELMTIGAIIAAEHKHFTFTTNGKANEKFYLWYEALKNYPAQQVQEAAIYALKTSHFEPKVADIITAIDLLDPDNITTEKAWQITTDLVRRFGSYQKSAALLAAPHLIREAIETIGYKNLCTSNNLVATRAHFFQCYNSIKLRDRAKYIVHQNKNLLERAKQKTLPDKS